MALKYSQTTELPTEAKRGRESKCEEIVAMAKKDPSQVVVAEPEKDEDLADLTKLYKALIQWRSRHNETKTLGLRKTSGKLYVFVITDEHK
jgi:hypothetical protein